MKQYKKFCWKSYLTNFLYSILTTSFILLIVSFFQLKWNAALLIAGGSLIISNIIFNIIFKPTYRGFAKYIDYQGKLSERAITMVDYTDDNSSAAAIQREDALKHIETLDDRIFRINRKMFCILAALILLFTSGIVVNYVKAAHEPVEEIEYVEANYQVAENSGEILGNSHQIIIKYNDTELVIANPYDDYYFVQWSDGSTTPFRIDCKVNKNITVNAIFEALEDLIDDKEEEEKDQELEKEIAEESKIQEDLPSETTDNTSSDENGNGEQLSEGGKYEPNNQVIDGETYYGDSVFKNAYEDFLNAIKNLFCSDKELEVIVNYYDNIEQ